MAAINIAEKKKDIISVRMFEETLCVFKRLTNPLNLSYLLEIEASRRLKSCDQIYNVIGTKYIERKFYIVSEYISGTDFTEAMRNLTEQQIISVVCQVLALIYLINVSGISHNDLHCSNIRVQPTKQEYVKYFCEEKPFKIKTWGVKAFILDFGESYIVNNGKPVPAASQLFSGDSFMRLDVRYDMFRFLKSFTDCMTWKRVNSCKNLRAFITSEITKPLKLGIYGIPEFLLNLAPKMFNVFVKKLHPQAPCIDADVISILSIWPLDNLEAKTDIQSAFATVRGMDHPKITHILNYIIGKETSYVANTLIPLVNLWHEFIREFSEKVSTSIVDRFAQKTLIQTPVVILEWILAENLENWLNL